MSDTTVRVIPVEIHGQQYPIKSELDPEYIAELARYVDEKIQAAGAASPAGDSLRLAVLAALNIADEYFRCRRSQQSQVDELAERTLELERLVDEALSI